MTGMTAELTALLLLAVVLVFAMVQPYGLPEATAALPAAGIVVALGILTPAGALVQLRQLGPTAGFLATLLVLGHLAHAQGVFDWIGDRLASASRGRPRRLLTMVFLVAMANTAVLSVNDTVVFLTPAALGTARRLRLPAKPYIYTCAHLDNSASTLLPISNTTNVIAFPASGLSFLGFAGLMVGPWLVGVAVEFLCFRWFFATDLADPTDLTSAIPSPDPPSVGAPRFALTAPAALADLTHVIQLPDPPSVGAPHFTLADLTHVIQLPDPPSVGAPRFALTAPAALADLTHVIQLPDPPSIDTPHFTLATLTALTDPAALADLTHVIPSPHPPTAGAPRFALTVLGLTLAGFAVSSFLGIPLLAVALAGTGVLAVKALACRQVGPWRVVVASQPLFCVFVLALGVLVAGVTTHGLGALLSALVPSTPTLLGLLALAGLAAALCNLVNNNPAVLMLLGVLGDHPHPGLVLAVLLGVDIGPNLTYVGSLANMLWRRVLASRGVTPPSLREWVRLSRLTVPTALGLSTLALWLALTLSHG